MRQLQKNLSFGSIYDAQNGTTTLQTPRRLLDCLNTIFLWFYTQKLVFEQRRKGRLPPSPGQLNLSFVVFLFIFHFLLHIFLSFYSYLLKLNCKDYSQLTILSWSFPALLFYEFCAFPFNKSPHSNEFDNFNDALLILKCFLNRFSLSF